MTAEDLREQVRERYAAAAAAVLHGRSANEASAEEGCCTGTADCGCDCQASSATPARGDTGALAEQTREPLLSASQSATSCCGTTAAVDEAFGSGLYGMHEQDELPAEALAASLGCGNPTVVADLRPGERVLDLGSGGGIDVLLSARRVGPTGFAFGVDMTDEMLELAIANAAKAGARNVEFLKGAIEAVPLSDEAVDVVISNCVVNLSPDKPAVLREMFRVLVPGGRIGISDLVADDELTPADRASRGSYVGCIAGALSRSEYIEGLAEVGFVDAEVTYAHQAVPGMHSAIVRAVKPAAPA